MASYRALRSRITGEPLAMTDSDTVPTPLDSLGKYGPQISNIISREHKVISSVRSLTDAGMYTDDRIFVLAYAMREVIRINSEMDEIITSIIGHEHAEGFGSDISRMDADIRSQMSNIENIMATA